MSWVLVVVRRLGSYTCISSARHPAPPPHHTHLDRLGQGIWKKFLGAQNKKGGEKTSLGTSGLKQLSQIGEVGLQAGRLHVHDRVAKILLKSIP